MSCQRGPFGQRTNTRIYSKVLLALRTRRSLGALRLHYRGKKHIGGVDEWKLKGVTEVPAQNADVQRGKGQDFWCFISNNSLIKQTENQTHTHPIHRLYPPTINYSAISHTVNRLNTDCKLDRKLHLCCKGFKLKVTVTNSIVNMATFRCSNVHSGFKHCVCSENSNQLLITLQKAATWTGLWL